MYPTTSSIRIAIYGSDETAPVGKGVGLWPAGYVGALTAAGANPEFLDSAADDESWDDLLGGVHGVVFPGWRKGSPNPFAEEGLCHWCRDHHVPLLAIVILFVMIGGYVLIVDALSCLAVDLVELEGGSRGASGINLDRETDQ